MGQRYGVLYGSGGMTAKKTGLGHGKLEAGFKVSDFFWCETNNVPCGDSRSFILSVLYQAQTGYDMDG